MEGKSLFYWQVILIFLLILFSEPFEIFKSRLLLLILILAAIIAVLSVLKLGKESYSPFPKPKTSNILETGGVYSLIRHPIYTGLILICFILLLTKIVIGNIAFFILIFYVTNKKADLEEQMLGQKHANYHHYKSKTKKFIPFIF